MWLTYIKIVEACFTNPILTEKDISSVESQKGIIAAQRYSVENQKGAIAVQSQW